MQIMDRKKMRQFEKEWASMPQKDKDMWLSELEKVLSEELERAAIPMHIIQNPSLRRR